MSTPAQTVSGPSAKAAPEALRAQRRTLLLFFAAFLLPVIAAYLLLATGWWTDAGTVNRGDLLTPPITLSPAFHEQLIAAADQQTTDQESTEKKPWVILAAIDGHCNVSCQNALMLTRQTQTLLGTERHRVQAALIHTTAIDAETQKLLEQNFPHLNLVSVPTSDNDLSTLRQRTQILPAAAQTQSQLMIIDPLGNGMLLHTVPENQRKAILNGKGFVKDLKRLLKYSRIG